MKLIIMFLVLSVAISAQGKTLQDINYKVIVPDEWEIEAARINKGTWVFKSPTSTAVCNFSSESNTLQKYSNSQIYNDLKAYHLKSSFYKKQLETTYGQNFINMKSEIIIANSEATLKAVFAFYKRAKTLKSYQHIIYGRGITGTVTCGAEIREYQSNEAVFKRIARSFINIY